MTIRIRCRKPFSMLMVATYLLISCHQDPALPTSLIPYTCWIAQADYIDTTSRVVYAYEYDSYGNQIKAKSTSTTGENEERLYEFSADQYLLKQQVGGTVYTYEYEDANPKRIKRITGGLITYEYGYDGSTLKTYTVRRGSATDQYEFGSDGRLKDQDLTLANGDKISIKGGKVVLRTASNGTTTARTFDDKGQITKEVVTYPSSGLRTETTYIYDDKRFYSNATLRARGFPGLIPDGQPGYEYDDAGGPVQINNYQAVKVSTFRNATNELLISKPFSYTHQYNQENYSLGYARSDGGRARFHYRNCK